MLQTKITLPISDRAIDFAQALLRGGYFYSASNSKMILVANSQGFIVREDHSGCPIIVNVHNLKETWSHTRWIPFLPGEKATVLLEFTQG